MVSNASGLVARTIRTAQTGEKGQTRPGPTAPISGISEAMSFSIQLSKNFRGLCPLTPGVFPFGRIRFDGNHPTSRGVNTVNHPTAFRTSGARVAPQHCPILPTTDTMLGQYWQDGNPLVTESLISAEAKQAQETASRSRSIPQVPPEMRVYPRGRASLATAFGSGKEASHRSNSTRSLGRRQGR